MEYILVNVVSVNYVIEHINLTIEDANMAVTTVTNVNSVQ